MDYLKSFRDFGSETSCDHLLPHSDLEPGRLIMEFRSNKRQDRISNQASHGSYIQLYRKLKLVKDLKMKLRQLSIY